MAMNAFLSGVNWDVELNQRDIEEAWNVLSAKCNKAIDQFVPMIKPAPYMISDTKHFINKRERLFNIYIEPEE